ncbi:MAG: hypothetical protein ABIO80_06090, partial [Sphingomicrobium sp.]
AAERAARLNGEIVAADFYLRQVTVLETIFDLTNHAFGWDASAVIRKLRRGRFDLNQIVDTPFADLLDQSRRAWWAAEGDPERPSHPDPHFLLRHDTEDGACTTYADQHSTGATTTPARGHSAEQWAAMNEQEQRAARQAQFAEDAAEQKKWEARAIAEHRAQSRSDP